MIPAGLAITSPRRKRLRPIGVVIVTIAVAAAIVTVWRMTSRDPTAAPDTAVVTAPPAAPAPVPPAPEPVPAAEITTTRTVWVRVLVDGERTIERELPANSRIPLNPSNRIDIRAGDAGAVRVVLGGKDQGPLGRDGIALTRRFDVSR